MISANRQQIWRNFTRVALSNHLSKFFTLASGFCALYFLSPTDFGIHALVMAILSLVWMLEDIGLQNAVLQSPSLQPDQVTATGFWLHFSMAVLSALTVTHLIAPYCAAFYQNPELQPLLSLFSLLSIIQALKFLPTLEATRENRLDLLFYPSLFASITYATVLVLAAFLQAGYWSFLFAKLASSLCEVLFLSFILPWRIPLAFQVQQALSLLRFSQFMLLASILGNLANYLDNLIIGKLLGMELLGFYTIAYRWSGLWISDLAKVYNKVLYPLNLKYQQQPNSFQQLHHQSLSSYALLTFPIACGMILLAPEAIDFLLDNKWQPLATPFRLFVLFNLLNGLTKRGHLLVAIGKVHLFSLCSFLYLCLLVIGLFLFLPTGGVVSAALVALSATFMTRFLLVTHFVVQNSFLSWVLLGRALVYPLVWSLVMSLAVLLYKQLLLTHGFTSGEVLVGGVLLGGGIYTIGIWKKISGVPRFQER